MASNANAITLAVVLAGEPGTAPAPQKVSDVPVIPREKATDEIPTAPSGASLLAAVGAVAGILVSLMLPSVRWKPLDDDAGAR